MTTLVLIFPEIFLRAGTDVILGMGLACLFIKWLADAQFEMAAVAITLTGSPVTIPFASEILDQNEIL